MFYAYLSLKSFVLHRLKTTSIFTMWVTIPIAANHDQIIINLINFTFHGKLVFKIILLLSFLKTMDKRDASSKSNWKKAWQLTANVVNISSPFVVSCCQNNETVTWHIWLYWNKQISTKKESRCSWNDVEIMCYLSFQLCLFYEIKMS